MKGEVRLVCLSSPSHPTIYAQAHNPLLSNSPNSAWPSKSSVKVLLSRLSLISSEVNNSRALVPVVASNVSYLSLYPFRSLISELIYKILFLAPSQSSPTPPTPPADSLAKASINTVPDELFEKILHHVHQPFHSTPTFFSPSLTLPRAQSLGTPSVSNSCLVDGGMSLNLSSTNKSRSTLETQHPSPSPSLSSPTVSTTRSESLQPTSVFTSKMTVRA